METPRDYVLLEYEKKIEDSVELAGHKVHLWAGEHAFSDGSYNPEERKRIWGIVKAIPRELSSLCMDFSSIELCQIPQIIKNGDKVYFHYLSYGIDSMIEVDKVKYLKVRYDKIFCVVRDGVITPVSGWVFIKKKEQEISALEFSVKKEVKNTGIVAYLPAPFIGNEEDLSIGDTVCYEKDLEFENTIEGEKFYLIKRDKIICKLEEQL